MRKVILQEFVTLDGLAAGPDGSLDFISASMQGDQAFGRDQLALIPTCDAILLGRATYQLFAAYWPNVTEGDDKPFADAINATERIVFSNTLERAPWGRWKDAAIAPGNATEEVARLKRQPGRNMILWGSISLAQSLMKAGLVDEYRLVVCPVVLGKGRALFDEAFSANMRLLEATVLDRGAVSSTYVLER